MPLANFFGKNALAAHQILNGMTPDTLAGVVGDHVVALAIDDGAAAAPEGRAAAELAIGLAARLYPRLALLPVGRMTPALETLTTDLAAHAREIHPGIELQSSPQNVTVTVVLGTRPFTRRGALNRMTSSVPTVYAGSRGWTALVSPCEPVGSGASHNPFGAGAAACFAFANVFRTVFAAYLPHGQIDEPFALSLVDYSQRRPGAGPSGVLSAVYGESADEEIPPVNLGETFLAGVGAIGNAAVWALARVPHATGVLHLIDPEVIELSNLQRYVLATQEDAADKIKKVDLAARVLTRAADMRSESGLRVVPHAVRWGQFLSDRRDWRLDRVLTAFDTVGDRLTAQAALPRTILNAWTQIGDLGLSRHLAFGRQPCLGCLYRPSSGGKSEAEMIGDALGLPGAPHGIRELLYSGAPISEAFIRGVAQRRGVTTPEGIATLLTLQGRSLRRFYNDAVCGGVILRLGGRTDAGDIRAEAPMAFQSALAGIMLGAELVLDAGALRRPGEPAARTVIDLLRPLAPYLEPPLGRREDGRCFCQDADYLRAFAQKYGSGELGAAG